MYVYYIIYIYYIIGLYMKYVDKVKPFYSLNLLLLKNIYFYIYVIL